MRYCVPIFGMIRKPKVIMLIVLSVAIFVAGAILYGLSIYEDREIVVQQELSGIQWQWRDDKEDSATITIIIDGIRSENVTFKGTIVIKSGDDVLYRFENCRIYDHRKTDILGNSSFLSPDFGEIKATNPIEKLPFWNHYACVYFNDDLSQIMLMDVQDPQGRWNLDENKTLFAAPARTHEEAVALAECLAVGTSFENNTFD